MSRPLCECGCGREVGLAPFTHRRRGWVKGQPLRFISGHNAPRARNLDTAYDVDENGCWIYRGHIGAGGYARITVRGVRTAAHRVYYERKYGPLLDQELHHECGVPSCVNPDHLSPLTADEHRDAHVQSRSHCRRGHSYEEHGRFHKSGARFCRACERENARKARESVAVRGGGAVRLW